MICGRSPFLTEGNLRATHKYEATGISDLNRTQTRRSTKWHTTIIQIVNYVICLEFPNVEIA